MIPVIDQKQIGKRTKLINKNLDDRCTPETKTGRFAVKKSDLSTSDKKFRQPETRTEFTSFFLHFVAPRPFYKCYSYV